MLVILDASLQLRAYELVDSVGKLMFNLMTNSNQEAEVLRSGMV
jgi:hypothetical protein